MTPCGLWLKWIHNCVIKQKYFWFMNFPLAPLTLRNYLALEAIVKTSLVTKSVMLQTHFLWQHNCQPLGPLYKKFGERVVFNLKRSLEAKVGSILSQGSWK